MKAGVWIAAVVLSAMFFSCSTEEGEVNSTLVGSWAGAQADFNINPEGILPAFTITEDTVPVRLDFKSDGTVFLTDNKGARTSGTYSLSGRQLIINIDYEFEIVGLAGTYDVEELTASDLRIKVTKEGTYTDPNTNQTFNGEVETTLYFKRHSE